MQILIDGTPDEIAEFVSKQCACVDEDKIKKMEEITDNYVKTMCNPKTLGDYFTESLRKQMIEHKDNPIDFGGDDDANEDVHEDVHEDDEDEDAHEDVHEDAHEEEKEVSDADKFSAELQQLLGKYPQFKNIEFKTGELTIDSSE